MMLLLLVLYGIVQKRQDWWGEMAGFIPTTFSNAIQQLTMPLCASLLFACVVERRT
jgi:hypothetical protein